MNFSPFSCPIFLGHREARGRCSQGERVVYGRDLCPSGGTGKAEAAKPPGAGIGPKQCPGKCAGEKGHLPESVRINDEQTGNEHEVNVADYAARFARMRAIVETMPLIAKSTAMIATATFQSPSAGLGIACATSAPRAPIV